MHRSPEVWLSYPPNQMYEISNHGRVRSVSRIVEYRPGILRRAHGQELTPHAAAHGHLFVTLYRDGKAKNTYLHRAVLETFVGPPPPCRPCCLHANGDPTDNYVGNLRWGTQAENMADKVAHGNQHRGELTPSSKLTREQVAQIKTDPRGSLAVAKDYGISEGHVWRLRTGRSWGHVTGDLSSLR